MSLYSVQIAEILLPLITVPYLARRLEPDGWGQVVVAQAFAAWIGLMLEYGFHLSATRDIACHRDEPHVVARAVSDVMGAVVLLAVASAVPVALASYAVPAFHRHPHFLYLAWSIAVIQAVRPLWYFQGVERMRDPARLILGIRLLITIGILMWVSTVDDGWKVLVLQLGGAILVAAITLAWMYREVPFIKPGPTDAWRALQKGWSLFVFRAAVSLYTTINAFLLGLFVPSAAVAYYAGAERLNNVVAAGLEPISQSLYPHLSHLVSSDRHRAASVARVGLVVVSGLGVVLGGAVMLLAPLAVGLILGPRYEPAVPVLRVLALTIPLTAVSNVLGIQWMLPLGMDRVFTRVVLGAGAVNLTLALWLVPIWGPLGMAWAGAAAEGFVTIVMWAVLLASGRQFWKTANVQ